MFGESKSVCAVKNKLYHLCKWLTWPAGFLLAQWRAWGIYTSLSSLYSPQSSGLATSKGCTNHQLEGSSQLQTLPTVYMKQFHKIIDPTIPPDRSSCTLHVSWPSVDDAWENTSERAEGLRSAILLSSKRQQQGFCWNFTQNLHHSSLGRLDQLERGETPFFLRIDILSEAVLGKLESPKKQELQRGNGLLVHGKRAEKGKGQSVLQVQGI